MLVVRTRIFPMLPDLVRPPCNPPSDFLIVIIFWRVTDTTDRPWVEPSGIVIARAFLEIFFLIDAPSQRELVVVYSVFSFCSCRVQGHTMMLPPGWMSLAGSLARLLGSASHKLDNPHSTYSLTQH